MYLHIGENIKSSGLNALRYYKNASPINVTMCVPNLQASATTMLSKIFKKNETPPPSTPAPKQPAASTPAQIAAQVADKAAWETKLKAAIGDDAALLAIAKESPLIDIKHAAVEALTGVDALKRA